MLFFGHQPFWYLHFSWLGPSILFTRKFACLSNVSCLSQSHVCRMFHVCHSRMSAERFIHNLFVDQNHKVACLPNVSYTLVMSIRTTNSHVCRTFHTQSLCRSEPQSRMSAERFIQTRYVDQNDKVACLPNVSYTLFLSIRTTNSYVCRTFHTDSLCRLKPQIRMSVERFIHNRYVDQNHKVACMSNVSYTIVMSIRTTL